MATISFELFSNAENVPIYLRLSIKRGLTPRAKTGFFINPKDWSNTTRLPKQNTSTNKNLTTDLLDLKINILKKYNVASKNGVEIDINWLKYNIDVHFGRVKENHIQTNVLYWIEHVINNAHLMENAKGGYGLSKNRLKSYKGLFQSFKEYQNKKTIHILDLNKMGFDAFKKWLFDVKKYSPTTAIKKLTDLQKVVRVASEFTEISKDFHTIKFKRVSPYDDDMDVIFLNENDIKKIEEADLKGSEALNNARKWLILGCYTGQRGTDLTNRIIEPNFKKYGEGLIISIKQGKGNKNITIPVLPKVKEIYEKGLPYKISTQKLNEHIKTICKLAKIDEMVMGTKIDKETNRNKKELRPKHEYISTHSGRRTFACIHYRKLPTPVIMRVTGHKKESTFLEYINQSNDEHLDVFLEYYQTQELKERREPQLNIVKNVSNQ
ncbi:phage integrase SAM-like domain-containing protein [Tamlana flava]|uniref:phage integrase SAM-like domain-containing protein n=1 Tax=Tamlana flava TaxID=3158572 RepID=UPI00351B52B4